MAASSYIANLAKGFVNGGSNFCYWSSTTASFYITLVSNNYIPNEDDVFASAFSGAELGAASFTSGYSGTIRISMTSRTLNINTTNNTAECRAALVSWPGITAANGVAHAFIVIHQAGSDGTSPIVTYNSLGGFPVTLTGTDLAISFPTSGVFTLIDF